MSRRDDLEAWLARSHRVQRAMIWVLAVGIGLALVLVVLGAGAAVFGGVLALAAIVGGSGLWITHGHIADFERQLREVDRVAQG